ncbi:MAG TPA: hypothetical protein VK589_30050 [Chryseolinea sp.]|nr:hypothetical protein [Chryseolinea sp.]
MEAETKSKKEQYLAELAKLSEETLSIIVELAKRPGAEAKLKANRNMLKMFV